MKNLNNFLNYQKVNQKNFTPKFNDLGFSSLNALSVFKRAYFSQNKIFQDFQFERAVIENPSCDLEVCLSLCTEIIPKFV